ncbi:exopolysaccharide biosynthesis protein [Actinophytocola oryzae]|uniref:exopolysaccharide biosynthesis protein n=1 Tax=Actinophytocola oryzae TaxID=502181 RepID=UPI001063CDDB|nr:exopolysaccharide biosynthesis protein [Actinophytocola oryzae]
MNDDTARLAVVWHVLRQRWRLLIVIAVLGGLVGVGASLVFSPGYKTSASVLLQGARDPDQLLTEAQVAKSSVVLDHAAAALKWGVSGADLTPQVSAAVAEGNIIAITATADTPERAQQLADRVAQEYVTYSTQLLATTADASAQVSQEQQQTLRQQIIETNQKISDLHNSAGQGQTIDSVGVRTELEQLRTALSQATSKLDELDTATGQAKMVVMGPSERPTSPAAPTMTDFVAGGAAVFFLLGLFGHLFAARSDKRLRDEASIVSALGSGVLGGLDVPLVASPVARTGLTGRVRTFFLGDRPWHVATLAPPADEAGLEIRYRRVLSKLRDHLPPGPGRVLVVVAADDPEAARVAARLGEFSKEDRLELTVWETDPARPTVPDEPVPGVLAVVTAGTRTGWELVGIAEACADAGHEILGVVVAHLTQPVEEEEQHDEEPALVGAG